MNYYILLSLLQGLSSSVPAVVNRAFNQPQIIATPPIEVPIYDASRARFDPALYGDNLQTGTSPCYPDSGNVVQ